MVLPRIDVFDKLIFIVDGIILFTDILFFLKEQDNSDECQSCLSARIQTLLIIEKRLLN